jgi:uncharacterized protein
MDHVTAFTGHELFLAGSRADVSRAVRQRLAGGAPQDLLVFDDETGEQIDIDLRDLPPPEKATGPGRPRLGVVAREVTLLPRHWEWLATQPGGASVTLRKLVEAARYDNPQAQAARRRQEAAYRFMLAIGGNLPGFEEAARALFAGDHARLAAVIADWPADVRDHALKLASH